MAYKQLGRPKKTSVEKYEDARMGIALLSDEERIATVFAARLGGYSHQEIYKLLQDRFGPSLPAAYSEKSVLTDLQTALSQVPSLYQETADDLIQIENARFERMLSRIWNKVEDGDLRAIETALDISKEKRKMLGLDQKERIEVDFRVTLAEYVSAGKITPADIVDEFGEEVLVEVNEKLLEMRER